MSKPKAAHFRTWYFLSLITTSMQASADHEKPLSSFSNKTQSTDLELISDTQHCEQNPQKDTNEPLCERAVDDNRDFDTKPILNISTQLDIRPESCFSFFDDYRHTRRGLRIETALSTSPLFNDYQKTVSTFPVIDFIASGHAHVVKSKDLAAKIYQGNAELSPLYKSIIMDAEEVNQRIVNALDNNKTITATAYGESTSLQPGDITALTLHVVIQTSIATESQIEQIKLAENELNKQWGFKLRVIEIP